MKCLFINSCVFIHLKTGLVYQIWPDSVNDERMWVMPLNNVRNLFFLSNSATRIYLYVCQQSHHNCVRNNAFQHDCRIILWKTIGLPMTFALFESCPFRSSHFLPALFCGPSSIVLWVGNSTFDLLLNLLHTNTRIQKHSLHVSIPPPAPTAGQWGGSSLHLPLPCPYCRPVGESSLHLPLLQASGGGRQSNTPLACQDFFSLTSSVVCCYLNKACVLHYQITGLIVFLFVILLQALFELLYLNKLCKTT